MDSTFEVSYEQRQGIATIRTDVGVIGEIVMDSRNVPREKRGGNASALLVAAALTCFCGTLREALEARNIPFHSIHARGKGLKKSNPSGAVRLTSLDIDAAVDIDDQYAEALAHCISLVKECMITASLADGIKVTHSARRRKI